MMVSNRNLPFQWSIFRFHVCFGGCIDIVMMIMVQLWYIRYTKSLHFYSISTSDSRTPECYISENQHVEPQKGRLGMFGRWFLLFVSGSIFRFNKVSFWMFAFFGLVAWSRRLSAIVIPLFKTVRPEISIQTLVHVSWEPRCGGHLGRIPRCLVNENGVLKEWDLTVSTWNRDQESFEVPVPVKVMFLIVLNLLFYLYTYRS